MPTKPRTTPKTPRTRRTPQQRAEQALAVAERRAAALTKQRNKPELALSGVKNELDVAIRRRDYLAQNPDLPQPAATKPSPAK